MLNKILILQILALCLIQNTFSSYINYQVENNSKFQNKNRKIQKKSNQNNDKQIYNYDVSTGLYVLENQQNNNKILQKESIYEVDPITGRYRLTKRAKKQILEKYDSRIITQQLNTNLQSIITSILECNNINDLNLINTHWENIIVKFIIRNKLSKQYIKGIWEAWYNKYKKLSNKKLLQLCNNTNVYKSVSKINIFNIDGAMKFIDSI